MNRTRFYVVRYSVVNACRLDEFSRSVTHADLMEYSSKRLIAHRAVTSRRRKKTKRVWETWWRLTTHFGRGASCSSRYTECHNI